MSRWNVIIAALDDDLPFAQSVCQRLTENWHGARAIEASVVAQAQVTPDNLKRIDLVVLTAMSLVERSSIASAMTAVEQADAALLGVIDPSLELHTTVKFAGALMLPPHSTAVQAAALGLLHRQRDFHQLNQELSIAQRFHGGLEGEISRMHEELQLAAMVQREMLPRTVPSLLGVTFAAMWRPANYVSGDLYDIQQLDDEHIGVFIADAVGHGVPAALMTMIISRSLVMTETHRGEKRVLEPSQVLTRLNNEMMLRQGQTTRFATGIYAVMNCRTHRCRLAGAGHPPPLLLRSDGSEEMIETSGGLLGVFGDETYDQVEIELSAGDQLLLYSDGFEQAFPNSSGDMYERRLPTNHYRREFEQLAKFNDPVKVVNHIRQRLDEQLGSLHQADDLTLICMNVSKRGRSTLRDATDRLFTGR